MSTTTRPSVAATLGEVSADLIKAEARVAELESEINRLRLVICAQAHVAATLGSGHDGWMRGRFMSISNALNAAIGRSQSVHGEQYPPIDKGNS